MDKPSACSPAAYPGRDPSSPLSPGTRWGPARGVHVQTPGAGPGPGGPIRGRAGPPDLKACPYRCLCLACPPTPWLACLGLCPSSLAWVSQAGLVPVTACHLDWSPWLLDREHFEGGLCQRP